MEDTPLPEIPPEAEQLHSQLTGETVTDDNGKSDLSPETGLDARTEDLRTANFSFFKRSLEKIADYRSSRVTRAFKDKAREIGCEAEAEALAMDAAISPEQREIFAEYGAQVADKYGLTKMAMPELVLLGVVAAHFWEVDSTFKRLEKLAEKKCQPTTK